MDSGPSDASPASSSSYGHASDHRSVSTGADAKEKERRVPLACLRCRAKRARCSGVRPRCKACETADVECQWPEGRKRKRTRKEMEEAERREREASAASATAAGRIPVNSASPSQELPSAQNQNGQSPASWGNFIGHPAMSLPQHASLDDQWRCRAPISHPSYIWPPQETSVNSTGSASDPTMVPADSASEIISTAAVPPDSNEQLIRALESQTAFVEGNPNTKEELELYYYRMSGSTAIYPGVNRISLKLQPRPLLASSAPVPTDRKELPNFPWPNEIFDENNMPLPEVYLPLIDVFFRTIGSHFPSFWRRRLQERLESGTMSAFYLNCLCAVAARFHPGAEGRAAEACAPFITKAQELVVPLLYLPTHDTTTALLLLSWACYGQNSEAVLWQYSGMAFRMAFDLGLHEVSEIYESQGHVVRTRLLFWSLFITDRIISFSTGRSPSISEDAIEIPLPTDEDFFPDPARNTDPTLNEPVEPIPFQYLVRAMILCGRISTTLNSQKDRPRTLVGTIEVRPEVLSGLQAQLVQFYAGLPDSMKWSVDNFKHQEQRGHGGTFLTLHLWTNAVMALVYHPELTMHPSGAPSPITQTMHRSLRLSLSSARNISECLVFADLFSSTAYLSSPFCIQPIFVACLAFIHEIKRNTFVQGPHPSIVSAAETTEPPSAEQFMSSIARQNLTILTKALQRMQKYWAGISYVLNILDQRVAGLGLPRIDSNSNAIIKFISLPDMGILRRYAGKNLPHNTAAATDTSLRESIEEEQQEAAARATDTHFSVQELLANYDIRSLFVVPANNYDLEQLLGPAYHANTIDYGFQSAEPSTQ